MKRTATILGVAAALAVPSVGSAASKPQDVVLVKPQVATTQVAKVKVATVQVARTQRARVARVRAQGTRIVPLGTRIALYRTVR
jgi:hypothetical protein